MGDVIALLEALVAIESVNPALESSGGGEGRLAQFVQQWCQERGLQTHWLEPVVGRPSVVAVAKGKGGGRSLMLYAHLDTVGVEGMEAPFVPRQKEGFLYGRGACDLKSGLAAAMKAVEYAAGLDLAGDVLLVAVSDEEHGSLGMESVLEHFRADGAIVSEPTAMELCLAHRGFGVYELEIGGKASHTSQPQLGINAVTALGRVLGAIEQLDQRLQAGWRHPLLGCGSAQAVRVWGGSELFTTPAHAGLSYERRTVPGEGLGQVQLELTQLLQTAQQLHPELQAKWSQTVYREPFESPANTVLADCVAQISKQVRGTVPKGVGAPYWMDSALLGAKGIPTVIVGVTPYGLHAADERVDMAEVRQLEAIFKLVLEDFCA